MLSDRNENLLSTFGRDSQASSNFCDNDLLVLRERLSCNTEEQSLHSSNAEYNLQDHYLRFQRVLHGSKTILTPEYPPFNRKFQSKPAAQYSKQSPTAQRLKRIKTEKSFAKKLKTETQLQNLNSRVSNAITDIAQSLFRGKVESVARNRNYSLRSLADRQTHSDQNIQNRQKTMTPCRSTAQLNPKKYSKALLERNTGLNSRRQSSKYVDKENNMDEMNDRINAAKSSAVIQTSKSTKPFSIDSTYRKNLSKEPPQHHHIKSSFSIDMSSSEKEDSLRCSKRSQHRQRDQASMKSSFNVERIGRKIETIHNRLEQHQKEVSRWMKSSEFYSNKSRRAHEKRQAQGEEFNFELSKVDIQVRNPKAASQNCRQPSRTLHHNPKPSEKQETAEFDREHPLLQTLAKQIQLDFDLRHAKHMFAGTQETFYDCSDDPHTLAKWRRLQQQLAVIGLSVSIEEIKRLFLPTEAELDPFLSVGPCHEELVHSLIYAYEAAEIHWQQKVCKKWSHMDLRDIGLTIDSIDIHRKGFISLEDLARFMEVRTDEEVRSRDVYLMHKRFTNESSSRKERLSSAPCGDRLKFRAIIDNLIEPFARLRSEPAI